MNNFILKISKLMVVGLLFFLFVGFGYFLVSKTELGKNLDDIESLRNYILSTGVWSYLIFWLLQFLQVTFIPLPSMVTTMAGVLIFGPFITLIFSYLAIMLGSIVAFLIGRKYGSKLVVWVSGEIGAIKWQERMQKGKFVFFLMMLFPFFPDDLLCIISGANKMDAKFFILTVAITKFIGLVCICFLGNSFLFSFRSPVWIVIGCLFILVMFLSFIFKGKIEAFIMKNYDKKHKKTTEQSGEETGNF